ncbi:MAG: glycosyltransferase family 2 protein [Methanolinea sp.]|nr:glycosyltransferase family 2 protein [Methanolinea sp.]
MPPGTGRKSYRGPPPFSLVIPAYNEEMRIPLLLSQLEGAGEGEFIFVCEGTDRTVDLVRDFARGHPELSVKCLHNGERLGKGGAIRQGFLSAQSPRVGYIDADGSTSVTQMMILFSLLNGYDAIIGSRWVEGSILEKPQGLFRRLESRIFNGFIRLIFRLPFQDTQCGAKVFKKSAIDAIIGEISSTGFEFDVELLWRLQRHGFRIKEHPIAWRDSSDSHVTVTDGIMMLLRLIALRMGR